MESEHSMNEKDKEYLSLINKSGFPYQLRIEHEIRTTRSEHRWSIASHEHPWQIPVGGGADGYIDLVLEHDRDTANRLVIECKRVAPRNGHPVQWLFLIPENEPKEKTMASCLEVQSSLPPVMTYPAQPFNHPWETVDVTMPSLEAEFCIMPKDEPLLEARCSQLLESVEGLGEEEARIARSSKLNSYRLFIFPVLVTTAKIRVCFIDPGQINIADGNLSGLSTREVSFIRFRKSMATSFPDGKFDNLRQAHSARERTVFIVNGESIVEFLKAFNY